MDEYKIHTYNHIVINLLNKCWGLNIILHNESRSAYYDFSSNPWNVTDKDVSGIFDVAYQNGAIFDEVVTYHEIKTTIWGVPQNIMYLACISGALYIVA